MKWLWAWLGSFAPPRLDEPVPPPERPDYPCGLPDCFEMQQVVRLDGKYIVVECPVHECITSWEVAKRAPREQKIIRVQDGWRQHGTSEKRK